jgi:TM2 domain-containing membrane protein YozV
VSQALRMSGLFTTSITLALAVAALTVTGVSAQYVSPPALLQEDLGLYIGAVLPGNGQMAYRDTTDEMAGTPVAASSVAAKRKHPVLAAAMSFVLTGAGQAYNGQWVKGALMLGGTAASVVLLAIGTFGAEDQEVHPAVFVVGLVGTLGFPVWSMVDASLTSSRMNEANAIALELGPRLDLGFAPAPVRSATYGLTTAAQTRVSLSVARVRF